MKKSSTSQISSARIERSIRFRFNPLPNLTPESVTQYHSSFESGYLRNAAILWDEIEKTDDVVQVVAPKRKKAVSRHGYEIITIEDETKNARAKAHRETLEFFYDNLICTSALDQNLNGGLPMLVRQMMDAVGKRYSVHEILWQYREGGITATVQHVPLWYFENTTGKLRYLTSENSLSGEEMKAGEWLVTCGDGVMRACAIAYLFKHLPLQDWLIFSERYGRPAIKGKSEGKPGDSVWDQMEEAVSDLMGGDSIVVSREAEIDTIDFAASSSTLPYPALIERMDRALAMLWRGSDLSTISRADGMGASLQAEETDILEQDDAENITDTLNEQVDRYVIKHVHGDATPLAWVRIKTPVQEDIKLDLDIDKQLSERGYSEDLESVQRRYNRPALVKNTQPEFPQTATANEALVETEDLQQNARAAIAKAISLDLQPVVDRLTEIIDDTPDADLFDALEKFRTKELPEIAGEILNYPGSAEEIENLMSAALINGYTEAEQTK